MATIAPLNYTCIICKNNFPSENFYVRRRKRKDGSLSQERRNHCNSCQRKRSAKWQIENPISFMWSSAKSRAKSGNLPFNIEKSDIKIPEECPILKIKLKRTDGSASANSPTLDKIIPSLGYIKGNIQVISYMANIMKSNATPEEILNFCEWGLKTFRKEK